MVAHAVRPERELLVFESHDRRDVRPARERGIDRLPSIASPGLVPANSEIANAQLGSLATRLEMDAGERSEIALEKHRHDIVDRDCVDAIADATVWRVEGVCLGISGSKGRDNRRPHGAAELGWTFRVAHRSEC